MSPVEDFILSLNGHQKSIMTFLHEYLMTFPHIESKVRYKIPFYYKKSWVCYLNPKKGDKIEMCFLRGNELSNASGILDAKGRKQVYGIEFSNIKEINIEKITEILMEALILDDTIPYTSKRKKK